MKQQMIMNTKWGSFMDEIQNWCEAGWTVVPGTQGMFSSHDIEMFWVWIQQPFRLESGSAPAEFEFEGIDLDIHP